MPDAIAGTFTMRQVLFFTQQYVKNRFDNYKRDVTKRIVIKRIQKYKADRPGGPTILFQVESKSYPQYNPYFTRKDKRGRLRSYQRTTPHYYDCILQFDRLSIDTVHWRGRVGSGKVWIAHPSQQKIKQIYKETRADWKKRYSPERVREEIKKQKDRAKYLDIGDYNSQVNGINGDFIFRCSFAWWSHGHQYGRSYYGNVPSSLNPKNVIFLPKHMINFITVLLQQGVLKEG
ncbi:hypothetical protein LCGC14_2327860 [marine sediment metagenome]|uniref:Uncharacterized protein n=1 Tax=marine sediment metagenome TaxID=412755 RepID=A0A0F9FAR4_9ZZZZ